MSDFNVGRGEGIGGPNMHIYRLGRGEFGSSPFDASSAPVTDESRVRRLLATLGRTDDLAFDLVRITLKAVRDDEREACAKLCEKHSAGLQEANNRDRREKTYNQDREERRGNEAVGSQVCAELIRARGAP